MRNNTFIKDAEIKIIKVVNVIRVGDDILADLVTEQFGRRKQQRHYFTAEIWQEMQERGYI